MKKVLVINGEFCAVVNGITYGRFKTYKEADNYLKQVHF